MKTEQITTAIDLRLLPYERMQPVHDRIFTLEGEKVLQCRPFRWLLDGAVVSNGYESFPMESICRDNRLTIVHRFNDDLAIVTQATA